MAKRGRPPKSSIVPQPSPIKRRGRPPKIIIADAKSTGSGAQGVPPLSLPKGKAAEHQETVLLHPPTSLPHPFSHKPADLWQNALALSQTASDHYSMTRAEQELAFNLALTLNQGAHIVELGVTHGRTAIILCYAAKHTGAHYVGIDNFKTEGSRIAVDQALTLLELKGEIIQSQTTQVKFDYPVDYLLIDAGHDDFNVRADCQRWLPIVSPGGLVLFHAYNPDIEFGDPHYPVKYYAHQFTQTWETITYIPYLLVKQKPF